MIITYIKYPSINQGGNILCSIFIIQIKHIMKLERPGDTFRQYK